MLNRRFDTPEDLPGRRPVTWRPSGGALPLAVAAGAAWPPLLTLIFWPPHNWRPGLDTDWRLVLLFVGLIALPVGITALRRERERTGRPDTRMGIVWRFMLFGGLLAVVLQTAMTLILVVMGWFEAGDVFQAVGATETKLLIYGLGGLPIAAIVGVSYALWAGLCVAFIAFMPRPPAVKDRLGLIDRDREPTETASVLDGPRRRY